MKTRYIYPSTEIVYTDTPLQTLETKVSHQGITLREHYSGLAMQGIISSTQGIGLEINEKHIEIISKKSVMYADALLKCLSKTEK